MKYHHIPVMLNEVLTQLKPRPGENFLDGTLGGGGYTEAIAKQILPGGQILAIDWDEMAIDNFRSKISSLKLTNVILVHDNFKNISAIVKQYFPGREKLAGAVFDLGLSSAQLADESRGFSFNLKSAPLKMSFFKNHSLTAEEIINHWDEKELIKIFKEYGEEKFAPKIAKAIMRIRQSTKITVTDQLVEIISQAIPQKFQSAKLHPATKIFQALRLAVNQELENLEQALPQAVSLLKPGGRLAVIAYHSLEDRIIKKYFKYAATACLCPPKFPVCRCGHKAEVKLVTKGVLRPSREEVLKNSRARSAKLRVVEKI